MDGLNIPTGENVQEAAAPVVTDNAEQQTSDVGSENTAAEVKEPQSAEVNASFAAARRKAEEEYNSKLKGINDEFKRVFGNVKNPVTGKNIETYQDYLQAVEHQKTESRNKMLQEKGIDPKLIEQYVNESPVMRQAQQILEENNKAEAQRKLESDLKAIGEFAPEITSFEDLENHESCADVIAYVEKGLSLVDAFKLANFNRLSAKSTEAAKQAAINQAKSKGHMETTNSVSVGMDNLAPIPDNVMAMWRNAYPGLSMEQLTQKYNSVM